MRRTSQTVSAGLCVAALLEFAALAAPGQFQEPWRWTRYGLESGLPSSVIYDLSVTADGSVWAGTQAGLARYDGYRWHSVRGLDGPMQAPVFKLYPYGDGQVVFLLSGRLYRGTPMGLFPVPLSLSGKPAHVESFAVLHDRTLLVQAGGRLHRGLRGELTPFPSPADVAGGASLRLERAGDSVWLHSGGWLYEWTGQGWERRLQAVVAELRGDGAGGFLLARKGHVGRRGLWSWQRGQAEPTQVDDGGHQVVAFARGPAGQALAVYDNGEVRQRSQGEWVSYSQPPQALSLAHSLAYDRNGDLWIASPSGVHLFHASSRRWTQWDEVHGNVNALLHARDGRFWIGTGEGLYVRSPNGSFEIIEAIEGVPVKPVTGLAQVGSSRVDLQACKLEYSIVSPK